eukprot:gene9572-3051_t
MKESEGSNKSRKGQKKRKTRKCEPAVAEELVRPRRYEPDVLGGSVADDNSNIPYDPSVQPHLRDDNYIPFDPFAT